MLRTHTVTLPIDREPAFPDECVGCGARPERRVRAADRAFSWAALWFWLAHFAARKVVRHAPICGACHRRDTLARWGRWLAFAAVLGLGFQSLWPWLQSLELSRGVRKLVVLALVVALGLPLYFWTFLFPRAFTVEVQGETVEHHFARREYAQAFAARNDGWVA